LTLFLPANAQAQALIVLLFGDKIVGPNFQPGLSVSFVGSGFLGIDNKMALSWSIGMYGEIRLSDKLSLQPEFLFKNPGGAKNLDTSVPGYPFKPIGEPTLDKVINGGHVRRELRSIAFPVILKWVIGPVGLGAGPQFSVLTRATDTSTASEDKKEIAITDSVKGDMRGYDLAMVGSIECAFSKGDHLRNMRARFKTIWGLFDTVEHNPHDPIRNWSIALGLDIPIGAMKDPPKEPASGKPTQ